MNKVTSEILSIFDNFRMEPTPNDQYESVGKSILADKISSFILRNDVINFVMLGFPFKSPNTRDKVLGILPDMGEQLTLNNFTQFNEQVKKVYSPGINISIASDGYIFNDVLETNDSTVQQYLEITKDMGKEAPMSWYTLNDFYSGDTNTNRDKVMSQFGIDELELERLILTNDDTNYLYKGMIRFMSEELAIKSFVSGNQLHKAAKKLTRQMMMRNEAWSNLVRKEFSSYIRISMHPSVNNGNKYSFQLIPGKNTRHSPWHCVIVDNPVSGEVITMHKKDAEAAGYQLMFKDTQPYYYQIP